MRADDHADLVLLEEFVDDVGAVAHDVIGFLGVTNRVRLHSQDFI